MTDEKSKVMGSKDPFPESRRERWHELFSKTLDGGPTEADLRALSELVCGDEAACRAYEEVVSLETLLGSTFAASVPDATETPQQPAQEDTVVQCSRSRSNWDCRKVDARRRSVFGNVFSVAALLAILAVGMVAYRQIGPRFGKKPLQPVVTPDASQATAAHGVGVLAEQAGAVWQAGVMRSGAILPRGRLALDAGTAHLELFSGVQLVVEGRTTFTLESPLRIVLHQGAVRALVPDAAHGFEVVTAAAAIVDLGTEFAMRVDGGTTDVTVLQGEIEILKQRQEVARIDSGKSIRLREDSAGLEELASRVNLPSSAAVAAAARDRRRQSLVRWQASLETLEADRRLVGRYAIANPTCGRIVPNQAGRAPSGSDAAVVGGECAQDRWGRQFLGIDFTRSGSRLRLALPGQLEGLTLVCWAKVNSLRNDYNALLLTDGHDIAEPHWQILRDGRIFFSVKHPQGLPSDRSQKVFYSPSFWREEMSGRWVMLAVTYDRGKRLVKHFVNGAVISSEAIPEWSVAPHVRIGDASIANWAEPVYRADEQFTSRNLNGVIDEFLVFSEPLSEEEIVSLYESGNID